MQMMPDGVVSIHHIAISRVARVANPRYAPRWAVC